MRGIPKELRVEFKINENLSQNYQKSSNGMFPRQKHYTPWFWTWRRGFCCVQEVPLGSLWKVEILFIPGGNNGATLPALTISVFCTRWQPVILGPSLFGAWSSAPVPVNSTRPGSVYHSSWHPLHPGYNRCLIKGWGKLRSWENWQLLKKKNDDPWTHSWWVSLSLSSSPLHHSLRNAWYLCWE